MADKILGIIYPTKTHLYFHCIHPEQVYPGHFIPRFIDNFGAHCTDVPPICQFGFILAGRSLAVAVGLDGVADIASVNIDVFICRDQLGHTRMRRFWP